MTFTETFDFPLAKWINVDVHSVVELNDLDQFRTGHEAQVARYGVKLLEFRTRDDKSAYGLYNPAVHSWIVAYFAVKPKPEHAYWNDVEQGRYDDDPNPYHGDYSEM